MAMRGIAQFAGVMGLLLASTVVRADMGQVHVAEEGVTVSESAQKAIILHNREEEILILGTELQAKAPRQRAVPMVRFIPFPTEPTVQLAAAGAFPQMAALVQKYQLRYQHYAHSKGGGLQGREQAVELRFSEKLGSHDVSVIRVNAPAAFRQWVSGYFRQKGLPVADRYPEAEAIVQDYVARGLVWFVLDAVEVNANTRFVEPLQYRFKSQALYYPLKTSNTFGGQGAIELFLVTPVSPCKPGTDDVPYTDQGYNCLGQRFEASTSAELVGAENDLDAVYPDWQRFFGESKIFVQASRYFGPYQFAQDVLFSLGNSPQQALRGPRQDELMPHHSIIPLSVLGLEESPNCTVQPERGSCKGFFERYYFDNQKKRCQSFIWGGCQGRVPFETQEDCRRACEADVRVYDKP